jgi:hypothetical protein
MDLQSVAKALEELSAEVLAGRCFYVHICEISVAGAPLTTANPGHPGLFGPRAYELHLAVRNAFHPKNLFNRAKKA